MFDYEGIDDDQILALETFDDSDRLTSALMVINGIRKGIIESEEGLIGVKNILVSLTH